jgi:Zn-dependent protease
VPSPETIALVVTLLLALSWHEAAHAWVADKLGDPTARSLGRVSLNPLRHLDPFFSLVLPVLTYLSTGFAFGGGKPVPINPAYFRHKTRDFMLVALAGPGSNLALATGYCLVFVGCVWAGLIEGGEPIVNPFGMDIESKPSLLRDVEAMFTGLRLPGSLLEIWVFIGFAINVLLAVFNLIPIPPLDGSRVVGWLLPKFLQRGWYRLDRIGIFVVIGVVLFGGGLSYILNVGWTVMGHFAQATDWLLARIPLA